MEAIFATGLSFAPSHNFFVVACLDDYTHFQIFQTEKNSVGSDKTRASPVMAARGNLVGKKY
jgi:hypothetical protein